MAKHGIDNITIEQLAEVDNEKLDDEEIKYIAQYKCLAPNGYNLTTGGSLNSKHSELTIELMKKTKHANVDKHRNEKLIGLPAKVAYRDNPESIRINDHPLCHSKVFRVSEYGTFDKTKEAVIEFIKNLETSKVAYVKKELPPGLVKTPKGYRVNKVHKGKNYDKRFEVKTKTDEENKQAAVMHYNKLIESLNNN